MLQISLEQSTAFVNLKVLSIIGTQTAVAVECTTALCAI